MGLVEEEEEEENEEEEEEEENEEEEEAVLTGARHITTSVDATAASWPPCLYDAQTAAQFRAKEEQGGDEATSGDRYDDEDDDDAEQEYEYGGDCDGFWVDDSEEANEGGDDDECKLTEAEFLLLSDNYARRMEAQMKHGA